MVKKMSNTIRKSGFSLVEVLIAIGISTAGLLFFMKIQAEQAKNTATAKANSESDVVVSDIRGLLTRSGYCATSLNGLTLLDAGKSAVLNIRSPAGRIAYATGTKIAENTLAIKEMIVKDFEPETIHGLTGIATFEITLEKLKKTYGAPLIKRSLTISVDRDAAKKIINCSSLANSGLSVTPGKISKQINGEIINKVINEIGTTSESEKEAVDETKKIIDGNKQLKETMETLKSIKKMQEEMQEQMHKQLEEDVL
jgi:hypothetical protein